MRNNLRYTKSVPANVTSFMTTNIGGYTFGLKSADETKDILRNYRQLEVASDVKDLTILYQIHSNIVLEVTKENLGSVYMSEADGLFTTEPNIALGVLTADCYPVHLWGEKCVSVLHCGWRSANSGIIENAIELFHNHGDQVIGAHIGTGICKTCYEIKADMFSNLNKAYSPETCVDDMGDGSYLFDLRQMIMNVLCKQGINNYTYDDTCSCCSSDFYSYRRDNGVTGRMLSVIMRNG